MASFIQRMKRDKTFRLRVILIAAILLLFINSGTGDKKTARVQDNSCDADETSCNNGCAFYILSPLDFTNCLDKCDEIPIPITKGNCITKASSSEELCNIEFRSLLGGGHDRCVNCVQSGYYARASDKCCSGFTVSESVDADGAKAFLCREPLPGEETQVCNTAERGIAKILQGAFPNLDCKSAYIITIFGGIFLALIIFAAI